MTYEEIKEKYPIGKILSSRTIDSHHLKAWYTQEDITIYKQKYHKVEVFPIIPVNAIKQIPMKQK